jgi:hypothetical protein
MPVLMAAGLAGCAVDSPSGVGTLMSANMLSAEPHPTDPTMMIVRIRAHDMARDLDNAEWRRRIVATMLTPQCGQPTIEDARVTVAGTAGMGNSARLYTLAVRCPNGATGPAER